MSLQKNNVKKNVSVVILCAGEGTRLRKITETTPKPLIKIERQNNIPILYHTIHSLIKLEIKRIGIVIGHLGEKISHFISKLKEKHTYLRDKLIIIDTRNQYKLGSLFSFLSITKEKDFFTRDTYYLVIPGDTIFDYNIIDLVLNSISKNDTLIQRHPFMFYRNIRSSKLKHLYKAERFISIADIETVGSNLTLKKISRIKIGDIFYKDDIYQIIPLLVLDYNSINEISNIQQKFEIKSVWEALNHLVLYNKRIICIKIDEKYNFFDIDTESDFDLLKKREKDNRCSN